MLHVTHYTLVATIGDKIAIPISFLNRAHHVMSNLLLGIELRILRSTVRLLEVTSSLSASLGSETNHLSSHMN